MINTEIEAKNEPSTVHTTHGDGEWVSLFLSLSVLLLEKP